MPALNAQTTDPSMHPSQTKMEADPRNPDAGDAFFDLLEISLNDFITLMYFRSQSFLIKRTPTALIAKRLN